MLKKSSAQSILGQAVESDVKQGSRQQIASAQEDDPESKAQHRMVDDAERKSSKQVSAGRARIQPQMPCSKGERLEDQAPAGSKQGRHPGLERAPKKELLEKAILECLAHHAAEQAHPGQPAGDQLHEPESNFNSAPECNYIPAAIAPFKTERSEASTKEEEYHHWQNKILDRIAEQERSPSAAECADYM